MMSNDFAKKCCRAAIVVVGLAATQFLLYWPSLAGQKLLLPLDLLADFSAPINRPLVHDRLQADPICQIEPMRRFAVSEVRAGRLPLWDPHNYCGAPFIAENQTAVFSPFRLLDYFWPDPQALAWGQMLRALVGGIGAYCFFRRALHARFFAATFGAWIWPNCGFLAIWTMWPISASALWLPWVLLAIHRSVRQPRTSSIVMLALTTAFTLISGHSATGAHVLLASGFYAIWLLVRHFRRRRAIIFISLGWLFGGMLAAPQLLPTLDYMRNSSRLANRLQVGAETKPVGLSAFPQIFMPWIQGSTRSSWIYLGPDIPLESAIGGYVGLLTVMVFVPFGFGDRRRRVDQIFWLALAIFAAAYILDLPGAWSMSRSPLLSSLRGNRFIFVTAFALLAAAVAGFDSLLRNRASKSRFVLIGPFFSLAFAAWSIWRSTVMSEIVSHATAPALQSAKNAGDTIFAAMVDALTHLIQRFSNMLLMYAALCIVAFVCALVLRRWPKPWLIALVGIAALAEVIVAIQPINPQSDRSLYNWNMPALSAIANAEPGRICGVNCVPPMLNEWFALSDIRGYDAADPLRYLQFLQLLAAPDSPAPDSSAATFQFTPKFPSPLADFLNVRYLIYRGHPKEPNAARFVTPGYFVVENIHAMPRVSVPRSATIIRDETQRLRALADPTFDPHQTVILDSDVPLPRATIEGDAKITKELPSHIEIDYTMHSDGFVVLADTWDAGWRAKVNDRETPILRANHAFRAIAVPSGGGHITLDYKPASFTIGLWLAAIAIASIVLCKIKNPIS
jgi:hypothetical protein